MKKFAISLIALAAISTASFASKDSSTRNEDYYGKYPTLWQIQATNAMAVVKQTKKLTTFERVNKFLEENENGRN